MSLPKTILRVAGTYAAAALLGFVVYVASFRLPFGGPILFYRGVLLAIIAAVVLLAGLALARPRLNIDVPTIMGATFTSFAFNVCFLVLFPVTIDRSISVFVLSRIAASKGMTTDEITDKFDNDYLHGMNQMQRRVDEQRISGNVSVGRDGRVALTQRGRDFVALSKAASRWFRTDPRFVDPNAVKAPPSRQTHQRVNLPANGD